MNYKGISFPFRIDGRGGVANSELTYTQLERIKESIYQILLTYPGERVMEPEFGCRLRDFIFENVMDATVKTMIRFEIERAITRWEPRIQINNIAISFIDDNDNGTKLVIDLFAIVIKYQLETNFTFIVT